MKQIWLHDRQPDEHGNVTAQLQDEAGKVVSTFSGKSVEEVADKVLASYASASDRLQQLRRERKPDTAALPPKMGDPAKLSADERFGLRTRMDDPETAAEAVTEAVAKRMGFQSVEDLRANVASARAQREHQFYRDEAEAFARAHPDFQFSPEAAKDLYDRLQEKGWDGTRNNLAIVYDELKSEEGLLTQPQPLGSAGQEGDEGDSSAVTTSDPPSPAAAPQQNGRQQGANSPEPTLPAGRPRFAATSTAIRHTNGQRPAPITAPKLTREQIIAMPRDVYARRWQQEPAFRRDVDAVMSKRA